MSLIKKKKKNHSLNVFPVKMIRNFFFVEGGRGRGGGGGGGGGEREGRRGRGRGRGGGSKNGAGPRTLSISHPIILISSLSPPSTKTNTSVSEE